MNGSNIGRTTFTFTIFWLQRGILSFILKIYIYLKSLQAGPGEQDNKTTYKWPQEHTAGMKIKTSHTKQKGGG